MKIIALGTTSQDKLNIVKSFFDEIGSFAYETYEVDSGVASQPLSQEVTLTGSKNRSLEASKKTDKADISLGMEGGLEMIKGIYHLICAVTITDKNGFQFIGISQPKALPKVVSEGVEMGGQFGELIRKYKENSTEKEFPIEHVNELITRNESFKEAIKNAFSEYRAK